MIFSLLVYFLLPSLILSSPFGAEHNLCYNVTGDQVELPVIKFPSKFKLAAVFTDWLMNKAYRIFEAHIESKQAVTQRYYFKYISIGDHEFLSIPGVGCFPQFRHEPLEIPSELDFLSLRMTSILDLLEDLLGRKLNGVIRGASIQSGAEGVRWVSCQPQNVTASVAGASIEVVYAGEDSIPPPSSAFSNPTILFLTLTSYVNISDANSNISARISLQIGPFDDVEESDPIFMSDDGVWCEGLPTLPSLPMKFPKVFADHTRYIDVFGLKYDLSLVYDSIKDITADGVTKGFAGNFEERLPQDATQVIHDIRRGFEYMKSPSGCRVSILPTHTRDISENGTSIAPPAELFIYGFTRKEFSFYHNITIEGRPCSVYRAYDNGFVTQLHVDSEGVLVEVELFRAEFVSSLTLEELGGGIGTTHLSNARAISVLCFCVESVATVSALSSTVVSDGFGSSLSALLPRFSPHRFKFFFSDEKDALRVIFSIADPAKIYDKIENTTEELINALSRALATNDFIVTVHGSNGKSQNWTVAKSSLMPYPSADATYPGYSGSFMVTLGIFILLIGLVSGTGIVYLVERRIIFQFAYEPLRIDAESNEIVIAERELRENAGSESRESGGHEMREDASDLRNNIDNDSRGNAESDSKENADKNAQVKVENNSLGNAESELKDSQVNVDKDPQCNAESDFRGNVGSDSEADYKTESNERIEIDLGEKEEI